MAKGVDCLPSCLLSSNPSPENKKIDNVFQMLNAAIYNTFTIRVISIIDDS
jgi:hypothetical protein